VASRFAQEPAGIQLLEPMTGLIFMGVLDRHPRLKIVMAEAGLAWIPSMIQGLDIWYQRTRDGRRLTGDSPINLPKLLPSDYFHRQIWISFVDDPIGVTMVGSILDADKVWFRLSASRKHMASFTTGHRRTMARRPPRCQAKDLARQRSRAVWDLESLL
jgi:hypothetical protein